VQQRPDTTWPRGAKPVSDDDALTPASGSFIVGLVWASPSSGTLRYSVARLTRRTWTTAVTGVFSPIIFRACFNFAGLNALGRPPRRPRSRAAASPASVRSWTSSRSKPASAPKT